MDVTIKKSNLMDASVDIPPSKSHSIRAIFIAGLAKGRSEIKNILLSDDVVSAIDVMREFGAKIEIHKDKVCVLGVDGNPKLPHNVVNVGNSGTTLRFAMLVAAKIDGETVLTGDFQIQKRPIKELVHLINNLGGKVEYLNNENCAPVKIKGKITGGTSDLDAFSSQYLSSALITCPLLENDTVLNITRLNEEPYVDMTMWWLDKQNIRYIDNDKKTITIFGNQCYKGFCDTISGDYSQATFFVVLACISGRKIALKNLDITDKQGDKEVLNVAKKFGAEVVVKDDEIIIECKTKLKGQVIDMNNIPDALPALAVLGCFAQGETRLINVEQARFKETDRIHVMATELKKLGANIKELKDGLVIRYSKLHGGTVLGYSDHRIVMALSILGLCIQDDLTVTTAEAHNITFPTFFSVIKSLGGNIEK